MDFLTDPFLIDPSGVDGPVLVTGAGGCIGAWAVSILKRSGARVVAFDLRDDRRRPGLVMGDEAAAELVWETGDIANGARVAEVVAKHGVRSIIHLAGLQVPFCKADPAAGARVNVEGSVNVLEAARAAGVMRTVYASSTAALGIPVGGPYFSTLYGVYKMANEECAKVYWQDWAVPSGGIRPNVVYGLGRDQGMSSKCTAAILAASLGQPYEIAFNGRVSWLYAGEAAAAFIAAILRDGESAPVFNLNGPCESVEAGIEILKGLQADADVTCAGEPIPIPPDLDDGPLRAHVGAYPSVTVAEGIALTHRAFASLIAAGRIDSRSIS